MSTLLSVEEVQKFILARTTPLLWEKVTLQDARHRVVACHVVTDVAIPSFTNSAVDGYAVRWIDLAHATPELPVVLSEHGAVMAGDSAAWELPAGSAARVMTGAQLPIGADAMVMVEDVNKYPVSDGSVRVEFTDSVVAGQHMRFKGEDIEAGQVAIPAGTVIRSGEVALLAAVGCTLPTVFRRPRVALFSTGDEIVTAEQGILPPQGRLRNSNLPVLLALAADAGAEVVVARHLPDDYDSIKDAMLDALSAATRPDLIVAAGGVSMGERDYVRAVMEELGALSLWRVAMKPGKPVAFGETTGTLFFGLPGNPVSVQVTWEVFVRPALRLMCGYSDVFRRQVTAILEEDVPHKPGRREFVRVRVRDDGGTWRATTTGPQGSGFLRSMVGANGLAIVPEQNGNVTAGTALSTMLLEA